METAEHYKDSSWIDSYGTNNQDSHGTFVYLPKNFSNKMQDHFISKSKGYMNNISSQEVYKDFLTKPIHIQQQYSHENNTREEIHFITGMSIGYKRIMKELHINTNNKRNQKEKWTKNLMFYRKYELNNFNWMVLGDYLKPRIPLADFSGKNIKDALQDLASIMNYDFGIRNGEPFFEPTYKITSPQTVYYDYEKNDIANGNDVLKPAKGQYNSEFLDINDDAPPIYKFKDAFLMPEEISFINGKFYFMKGEIIFLSKNNVDNDVSFNSNILPEYFEPNATSANVYTDFYCK